MNYSIILLGATISLSLFLRICGVCEAMDVNTEPEYFGQTSLLKEISRNYDIDYGWLTGDPTYNRKSEFKSSLLSSAKSLGGEEDIDKLVDKWVSDLSKPKSLTEPIKPKFVWETGFFDDICGARIRNESHGCVIQDIIDPGEEPEGCYYQDEANTHLSCNDTKLTKIPPLPSQLGILDFEQTQITELHFQDFGNVEIGHIRFFNNKLATVDVFAFEKVKGLKGLQIIDNQIEYLAFEIYVGLTDLETLYLDKNHISLEIYKNCDVRDDDEIQLVLPQLKIFSLADNPLKMIPPQMWAGLRNSPVNTLTLSFCSLEFIDKRALSYLPQLKILDISGNPQLMVNLTVAFEGLKTSNSSLEKLYLMSNNLMNIPGEALAMISKSLTKLDLSSNPIGYITSSSFVEQMINLQELSLNNCKILSIARGSLEMFPNLKNLMLNNNQLTQIPPSIPSLKKLTYLNLDNNIYKDGGGKAQQFFIPPSIFENSSSIYVLSLAKLKIKRITNQTFEGLSKLSVMILDDSEITSIEDASFRDLVSLKSLTIKNNPLQTINSLTFYGMTNLEGLYMDNCRLNFPKPESNVNKMLTKPIVPEIGDSSTPFKFLPAIRWLTLAGNNIENVYPDLFGGAENMTTLDLTGNKIMSWNTPIFRSNYSPGYANLRQRNILMSNNKLTSITDAMREDIINFHPYIVDMTNNPFLCDEGACKLRDMLIFNSTEGNFSQFDNTTIEILMDLDWIDPSDYTCRHTNQSNYKIADITDEVCKSFGDYAMQTETPIFDEGQNDPSTPTSIITISVSIVCVTGLIVAAVITGYKKRVHLKYAWFVAKINIGKIPRKSKTSLVEVLQFDYDIFVSYHNSDRDFVQDEFLPEVEDRADDENSIDLEQGKSKGFRVALHERDFEAGVPIAENIVDCVDRSKKVVIIISKKYLESQWCTYEMNLAYHRLIESRRSSFVLVFLEEVPAELRTKVLNYLMRSRTFLEWPGNNASIQDKKRFWSRLISSMSSSDC